MLKWNEPEFMIERAPFIEGEAIWDRKKRLLCCEQNPYYLLAEAMYWVQRGKSCDLNPNTIARHFLLRADLFLASNEELLEPDWHHMFLDGNK